MESLLSHSNKLKNWVKNFIQKHKNGIVPFSSNSDINKITANSGLSPSIIALKTAIQTKLWNEINQNEQQRWLNRICSFKSMNRDSLEFGFLIDKPIESTIQRGSLCSLLLSQRWKEPKWLWRMSLLRQIFSTFDHLNVFNKLVIPTALSNHKFITRWLNGISNQKDIWSSYSHISGLYTILKITEQNGISLPISSESLLANINIEKIIK